MREVFVELYRHHLWANQTLFETCESLEDAALDAAAEGTYGTIRDTLVHMLAAESRYLAGMTGEAALPDAPKEGAFPGTPELKRHATSQGERLLALAERVTDNEIITVERGGRTFEIPLSIFFAQAINHGTEHRAHVCTALTQAGVEPPNLDVWQYLRNEMNRQAGGGR
ncbi:MAG TPA: DinB family protein, partial [Rubrobacter sp.]|nr:DinB family protein [Rubrobacter sp.]